MKYNFRYYPHVRARELECMPYAKARILTLDDGSVVLQSYDTIVCGILANGEIFCNGLFSRTTIRHISAFAREYGLEYYYFKKVLNGTWKTYNVLTGVGA